MQKSKWAARLLQSKRIPNKGFFKNNRPCTCLWPFSPGVTRSVSSNQAAPWHPQGLAYRCFLPDLTGFTSLRRTGPGRQHHFSGSDPKKYGPGTGIQPCYSGLQVQGTATSPSSTAKIKLNMAEREGFEPSRQGFAPSTRFPGERLRPAQPSLRTTQTLTLRNWAPSYYITLWSVFQI
jgi:hypothetical protein